MGKIKRILENRHRFIEYFYIKIPFIILGRYLAEKLEDTSVTPNMVSYSSILTSFLFLGVVYVKPSSAWLSIPLVLLVGITFSLDGSLARRQNRTSIFGSWLNVISEYSSYTIMGITFVYYAYVVNDYNNLVLFFALISYISRQGIYIIYPFTEAKIQNVDRNIFSKEFNVADERIVTKLKRTFTYNGYTYILIIIFGIIFEAHLYYLILIAFYGTFSLIGGLIVVGKNVKEHEKKNSN